MDTKNKIINSSIKFFLDLGYDNTSLSAIAEDVGIKKPSIYYHFKNKEELFILSMTYILESIEEKVAQSLENSYSTKNKIENICLALIEYNHNLSVLINNNYNKPINMINLFHTAANKFPVLKKRINTYYTYLHKTLKNAIITGQKNKEVRKEIDPKFISIEILAQLEGHLVISSLYSPYDTSSIHQSIFNIIMNLLTSNEPSKKFFKHKTKTKTLSLNTKW